MDHELKVVVDPEFENYLGPLDPEARQALEESLLSDGCRDAIVVWPQSDGETAILLDGHNRRAICERHGLSYPTVVCPPFVTTREKATEWIVNNQRARRNLTKEELAYLTAKLYAVARKEHGGDRKSEAQKSRCQNDTLISAGKTAEQIGQEFGISPRTVHRNVEFAQRVDAVAAEHGPEAKQDILTGRKRLEDYEPQPDTAPTDFHPVPQAETVPEILPGEAPPRPEMPAPRLLNAEVALEMHKDLVQIERMLIHLCEIGTPDKANVSSVLEMTHRVYMAFDRFTKHIHEGIPT